MIAHKSHPDVLFVNEPFGPSVVTVLFFTSDANIESSVESYLD